MNEGKKSLPERKPLRRKSERFLYQCELVFLTAKTWKNKLPSHPDVRLPRGLLRVSV